MNTVRAIGGLLLSVCIALNAHSLETQEPEQSPNEGNPKNSSPKTSLQQRVKELNGGWTLATDLQPIEPWRLRAG